MTGKPRTRVVIINRTCWPNGQVIGESLLALANSLGRTFEVKLIGQNATANARPESNAAVGRGVRLWLCRQWSSSSSSIFVRVIDAFYFLGWVALCLTRGRPKVIYVATDPPVVVPFIAAVYAKFTRAKLIYHVQDIHPEIANMVVPLSGPSYGALKFIDNVALRQANLVVTLSEKMSEYLSNRTSGAIKAMRIIDNAAVVPLDSESAEDVEADFVFCGNAGRLQHIEPLVEGIRHYLERGGVLRFAFAGGGVYSSLIDTLAEDFSGQVLSYGVVSPAKAMSIIKGSKWAMLPIASEVTQYAFPSKSSSYLIAGCKLLVVSEKDSAVSSWAVANHLGVQVDPDRVAIAEQIFAIEQAPDIPTASLDDASAKYSISGFVQRFQKEFEVLAGQVG